MHVWCMCSSSFSTCNFNVALLAKPFSNFFVLFYSQIYPSVIVMLEITFRISRNLVMFKSYNLSPARCLEKTHYANLGQADLVGQAIIP